jgi:heterodisulfide reductase subunit C
MTDDDMRQYAARHGLTTLSPANLTRMRELAERVAQTGAAIPRMPNKSDEPASVLTLPLRR